MSNSVSGDQPQLRAVLQENTSGGLLWVDADTIVCDDGASGSRNTELFSCEFQNRRKWSTFWNTQHFEGEFRIRCQGDFESYFGLAVDIIIEKSMLKVKPETYLIF